MKDTRTLTLAIQRVLLMRGYALAADGKIGPATLDAAYRELTRDAAPVNPQGGRRLAWGQLVSREFRDGVRWISDQFGWNDDGPSNLMSCMAWESDESFDPGKTNYAGSGAVGLIQFMPDTAHHLGTSTLALSQMPPERQLGWVFKYLKQFSKLRGANVTLADMYMSILLPSMIGQPEDATLFNSGIAYRQNSGLDSNRDGKITKLEAAAKVYAKLERGYLPQFVIYE